MIADKPCCAGKELSKEETYQAVYEAAKHLITRAEKPLSNMSNLSALLKQSFPSFSWVGFYLVEDDALWLGPFQGKVACTRIEIGKGVCGTAAKHCQTVVVPDVHKFEGHIACDSGSNSEIVVPILKNNELIGVLDIDSYEFNNFDDVDVRFLKWIVEHFAEEVF